MMARMTAAPSELAPPTTAPRPLAAILVAWAAIVLVAWLSAWDARRAVLATLAPRLIVLGLLVAAGWLVGERIRRALRLTDRDAAPFATALLLGWGALGLAWLALGLAQLWRPAIAWILLATLGAAGAVALARRPRSAAEPIPRLALVPAALATVVVAVIAVESLAPPAASDELVYHLTVPKWWVEAGGITALPHFSHAAFPFLTEMLYGWALLLGDPVVAKLVHLVFALACVALAAHAARREAGIAAGWCAAACLLTAPLFAIGASLAFVDTATAAFTLLGASLALRASASEAPPARLLVASGIAFGLACSTKYTAAAFLALALLALVAWPVAPQRLTMRLRAALTIGALAVLVTMPWLVRNAVVHGNPVHPMLHEVFAPGRHVNHEELTEDFGSARGWGDRARRLVAMHLGHARADDVPGLVWALALPVLAVVARGASRRLVAIGGAALIAQPLLIGATPRLLLPGLALLAVPLGAWLGSWLGADRLRRAAAMALLVAAGSSGIVQVAWQERALFDPLQAALGLEDRDHYLDRMYDAHPLLTRLNRAWLQDERVRVAVLGESSLFWLDAPSDARGPLDVPRVLEVIRESADADGAARRLREEGVTHVLVNRKALAFQLRQPSVRAAWTDRNLAILGELLDRIAVQDARSGAVELYRLPP